MATHLVAESGIAVSGGAFEHLKALVVEDNPHMRALLKSLLHALGIVAIFEACDGAEAFELLRSKEPDLILTDLTMSPIDGLAFVREVRKSSASPNPYVPIVMVTGHTEKHRIEAARDAGVTEVLAKPITAGHLIQRLTEIVNRPRPFVRSGEYFGPDRRRRTAPDFMGPFRRADDADSIAIR